MQGLHGVGLAIKEELWDAVAKEDKTVDRFGPRLMKVRLQLVSNGVTFVVGYAPTECGDATAKDFLEGGRYIQRSGCPQRRPCRRL